jgi:hypothetical protein
LVLNTGATIAREPPVAEDILQARTQSMPGRGCLARGAASRILAKRKLDDTYIAPRPRFREFSRPDYFAFLFSVSIRSLAAGPDEAGFWPVISWPSTTV